QRDRRSVQRNPRAAGGLLAVAGALDGRGDRMAQAGPVRPRRRAGDTAGHGHGGLRRVVHERAARPGGAPARAHRRARLTAMALSAGFAIATTLRLSAASGNAEIGRMDADALRKALDTLWRMESPALIARLARRLGDLAQA